MLNRIDIITILLIGGEGDVIRAAEFGTKQIGFMLKTK
jgi:hypothetical protein